MFKFALGNLGSRPVRSALSILGLTVAIGGMVGLFSIAGGIDQLVSSTFEMIPGLLVQQRGAPVPLFSTLPAAWQEELEQMDGVAVVNPEILVRANVIEGKTIISPPRFLLGLDIPTRLRLTQGVYADCLDSDVFLALKMPGP
jgi:putative ABC transport system permease protein